MPIGSIISQPAVESINAAYRPIVLRVSATKTNGDAVPPLVYCDVYVNGTYYKSYPLTQAAQENLTDSEWEFDIQDSLQESLTKYLGANGGSVILDVTPPISSVYCKFRSSGINSEGFLVTEDTAPIQGTSNTDPVAGTGTQSNTFYVVNATLQHEDNQDLAIHLNAYKQRDWDPDAYPLTHRPEGYKICKNQSDYFPILSLKQPGGLVLHYRPKDSSSFLELGYNAPCGLALSFLSSEELPDGAVGNPYYFAIALEGSLPITLGSITKPSWMTIAVNSTGTLLEFTGTPDVGGTAIPVSLTVSNCCGTITLVINETIDISACTMVAFSGTPDLPTPILNTPYSYDINLTGTAPFNLNNIIKPSWMTITVVGSQIQLRGTPDESGFGLAIPVSFDVVNCGGTISFSDTFDLTGGYACGGGASISTAETTYKDLGFYYLNIAPGTTHVSFGWTANERPNRFTLYKDGIFVESTGWKGYANYGGPWGSNLNTNQFGTIEFDVVPGSGYKVRIEVGPADPISPLSDGAEFFITCS